MPHELNLSLDDFSVSICLNPPSEVKFLKSPSSKTLRPLRMPTVEEATSGRLHWPRLVSAKDMLRTYRSLVLTQPSLERGEWWRLVSYLFIHQDLEHLLNNICGILCTWALHWILAGSVLEIWTLRRFLQFTLTSLTGCNPDQLLLPLRCYD